MATFRIEKNSNYTTMANYHFRDKSLSWKAKGILSNMLSLPDDWDYSMAGLVALTSDGASATRSALKELEEHGYLIRRPVRENGRIVDWEYLIFENPEMSKQFQEKPREEKPVVENPQVEKGTQLNTKESNTKKSNTKEKKVSKSFDEIISAYTSDEQTIKLLQEWLKVRKAKRSAMTDHAIQLNIKKLNGLAKQSNMSVNEYLEEVICRGWAAFYPINNYNKTNTGYSAQIVTINGKEYECKNGKYYVVGGSGVAVNPYEEDTTMPF